MNLSTVFISKIKDFLVAWKEAEQVNMASLVCVVMFIIMVFLVTDSTSISLGSSLTTEPSSFWLSSNGLFAFGFYQQDDGFAVGIWLTTKPDITVVWTANRDDPPLSSNTTIELTEDGILNLHTSFGENNLLGVLGQATDVYLSDSGGLVIYYHSHLRWSSLDYPCDTLLAGQQFSTGNKLVSSVSASQHSSGHFELVMQENGNLVSSSRLCMGCGDPYWIFEVRYQGYKSLYLDDKTGSLRVDMPNLTLNVSNPPMRSWSGKNETVVFRATLNPDGNFVLYSYRFTTPPSSNLTWKIEWKALQDPCKVSGICGVNSYCSTINGNATKCHCFPGFVFLNESRTGKLLGCYKNITEEEACSQRGVKLSYNITAVENMEVGVYTYAVMNLNKEACSDSCLDDCNCWASLYENGTCKMLVAPIVNARINKSKLATIFIKTSFLNDKVRVKQKPVAPLTNEEKHAAAERRKVVSILAITLGFLALMCTLIAISSFIFYRVHSTKYQSVSQNIDFGFISDHFTLRSFSFSELEKATDGFKEVIGRNSIGEVYKGFISEGKKAVAVKRLEKVIEGEGLFRAEITAIAQTHHRNLVRLLGFCIHGATKLLVYEFMSNGSVADLLLTQPDWNERVRVAMDVAKGMLYLHEECDTRIIHCNIKPHNILFDDIWTAKISDFGLSKLLGTNQNGTLTNVRGTRGYMAPEWHKNTLISTKVDIYSYGVMLLEILCCRGDMEIDILSEDKIPYSTWIYNCYVAKELNRLIGDEEVDIDMCEKMVKVGLLCIQDDPDARPSIKDVILMLEGTTDIPVPPSPTPLVFNII